jgi:hypothetical protein
VLLSPVAPIYNSSDDEGEGEEETRVGKQHTPVKAEEERQGGERQGKETPSDKDGNKDGKVAGKDVALTGTRRSLDNLRGRVLRGVAGHASLAAAVARSSIQSSSGGQEGGTENAVASVDWFWPAPELKMESRVVVEGGAQSQEPEQAEAQGGEEREDYDDDEPRRQQRQQESISAAVLSVASSAGVGAQALVTLLCLQHQQLAASTAEMVEVVTELQDCLFATQSTRKLSQVSMMTIPLAQDTGHEYVEEGEKEEEGDEEEEEEEGGNDDDDDDDDADTDKTVRFVDLADLTSTESAIDWDLPTMRADSGSADRAGNKDKCADNETHNWHYSGPVLEGSLRWLIPRLGSLPMALRQAGRWQRRFWELATLDQLLQLRRQRDEKPPLQSPPPLSLSPLAIPGRRLVRSGELLREDRRGRLIARYFYLFNDGILYGAFAGMGSSKGAHASDIDVDSGASDEEADVDEGPVHKEREEGHAGQEDGAASTVVSHDRGRSRRHGLRRLVPHSFGTWSRFTLHRVFDDLSRCQAGAYRGSSRDVECFGFVFRSPSKSFLVFSKDAADCAGWLGDTTKCIDRAKIHGCAAMRAQKEVGAQKKVGGEGGGSNKASAADHAGPHRDNEHTGYRRSTRGGRGGRGGVAHGPRRASAPVTSGAMQVAHRSGWLQVKQRKLHDHSWATRWVQLKSAALTISHRGTSSGLDEPVAASEAGVAGAGASHDGYLVYPFAGSVVSVSPLLSKAERYPYAFVIRFAADLQGLEAHNHAGGDEDKDDKGAAEKGKGAKHRLTKHMSRGKRGSVAPLNTVQLNAADNASMRSWMSAVEGMAAAAVGTGNVGVEGTTAGLMYAPLWRPDSAETSCELCTVDFTVARRRHHCRRCGALVCDKCSPHRWLLQQIDPQ